LSVASSSPELDKAAKAGVLLPDWRESLAEYLAAAGIPAVAAQVPIPTSTAR
jgi:hypothetical protein